MERIGKNVSADPGGKMMENRGGFGGRPGNAHNAYVLKHFLPRPQATTPPRNRLIFSIISSTGIGGNIFPILSIAEPFWLP